MVTKINTETKAPLAKEVAPRIIGISTPATDAARMKAEIAQNEAANRLNAANAEVVLAHELVRAATYEDELAQSDLLKETTGENGVKKLEKSGGDVTAVAGNYRDPTPEGRAQWYNVGVVVHVDKDDVTGWLLAQVNAGLIRVVGKDEK